MSTRPGRNDLCHCGSGSKYKKCCLEKDDETARAAAATAAATATEAAAAAAAAGETPHAPRDVPTAKTRIQPHGVSNRAPPPARRRSV